MGILGPARTASLSAGSRRAEQRRAFADMLHKQQQAAASATSGSRAAASLPSLEDRPPSASDLPADLRAPESPPAEPLMPPYTPAPLPQMAPSLPDTYRRRTRERKSPKVCPHCICELCQCGSHRCPPTPLHTGPMTESKTTYAGNYPWHPYGPSQSAEVKRGLGKHVPFDAGSTARTDFQWRGFPDRVPAVHSRRGAAPDTSLPFESDTTHRADYNEKPLAASARDLPRHKGPMADGRDFLTESRKAFNRKDARPATAYRPASGGLSDLPFDGQSLAASSYRPWATSAPRAGGPISHYHRTGDSRDFETEQRGQFAGKPLDRCPAIQVAHPPTKPFPGHVPVVQDPMTGAWRRSYHQHNPIPVAPSRPAL